MSKEELLKYLIAEIDLIMHDKDYRFENQDGTWYSRESCRDLTNEEVFEELRSELRQLADLEAKLAESEEDCEEFKKIAGGLREDLIENDCMYKKEIDQLKQQLSEKEKELEYYTDLVSRSCDDCSKLHHQDKISFAVEILENVLDTTENILDDAVKNSSLNQSYYDRLLDEVDNQIKQLKEGK